MPAANTYRSPDSKKRGFSSDCYSFVFYMLSCLFYVIEFLDDNENLKKSLYDQLLKSKIIYKACTQHEKGLTNFKPYNFLKQVLINIVLKNKSALISLFRH